MTESTKQPAAIKLFNTLKMTKEEWREKRHLGIGGSDVSAILGVNKYRTAIAVYMEKTGQWEAPDLSDNQAVHFGNKLEAVVAEEFAERTGYKIQRNNFMLQHPYYPWMLANIDREVLHPELGRGVLEIKTTSAWNADEWTTKEVPAPYMLQVQHYLAVTGYDFAYIAVLIGGNRYDHWFIERDAELINILIEQERIFWEEHIQAGNPPPLNYAADGPEILDRLYPAEIAIPDTIQLNGAHETELLVTYWANEQEIKTLEHQNEAIKNELKDTIKEHERAENEFAVVTWKAPKASETIKPADVKEKYPDIWDELKYQKKASRRFTITHKK